MSDKGWEMKTSLIANTLMLAGVGIYVGPQIASSLFPLVQEAHIVGVICLVGGLVVYALADRKKT
jgi:threonine/homoserine efflux transporter RhtA